MNLSKQIEMEIDGDTWLVEYSSSNGFNYKIEDDGELRVEGVKAYDSDVELIDVLSDNFIRQINSRLMEAHVQSRKDDLFEDYWDKLKDEGRF